MLHFFCMNLVPQAGHPLFIAEHTGRFLFASLS